MKPLLKLLTFLLLVASNICNAQSSLNLSRYPFHTIDVRCDVDKESLMLNKLPNGKILTHTMKIDSYYKYVDVCKCSDIFGIDFTKESLLLIIEATTYNTTCIVSKNVFVLKDTERRKIICVVTKDYWAAWDVFPVWQVVGVVIPKVPYGYKVEFVFNDFDIESYERNN
ncbi:MAG: hypothetical protein PHW82_04980 [Bacteroidales bacterium]|nr:hypothetical protein [Bacteroidales bacterium]